MSAPVSPKTNSWSMMVHLKPIPIVIIILTHRHAHTVHVLTNRDMIVSLIKQSVSMVDSLTSTEINSTNCVLYCKKTTQPRTLTKAPD